MMQADYLSYPGRRRGNEHDRYPWSNSFDRAPLILPGGKSVALMVVVPVEWFPLNMPPQSRMPIGALSAPYPDYWSHSVRDYGSRVGIYRIMQMLDQLGIRGTAPVNAAIALRYPKLIKELLSRNWELLGHGMDMGSIHHADIDAGHEEKLVRQSLEILRNASAQPIKGWMSPAYSESLNTPDLIAANGVEYTLSYVNDDLPYDFKTKSGTIVALPMCFDRDDSNVIVEGRNSPESFADQLLTAFEVYKKETEKYGARAFQVVLHPWITGQPSRIKYLKNALTKIANDPAVLPMTGAELTGIFKTQSSNGGGLKD